MQENMPKKHKKRFLTYCHDCQGYFKEQPSEWMLKHMERNQIDTWIIAKYCEPCLKKRKDDAQ
jgi:hypothetical protein